MHIGIDLDDTIIELSFNGYDWKFKNGVIHVLNLLTQQGHYLHIITARMANFDNREQLEKICVALEKEDVKITDVTYTMGQDKGRFAKDLQCLCLIDDHEPYIRDCLENGVKPILYSEIADSARYPGWRIARDWNEIYMHILSLEEQTLLNME